MPNIFYDKLHTFNSQFYDYPEVGWYILNSFIADGSEKNNLYKIVRTEGDVCYGKYIDRKKLQANVDSSYDGIFDWHDAYYYDLDNFNHAGVYWSNVFGFPEEGTIIWDNKPMIVTFSGKYTIDMIPYDLSLHRLKNNESQIIFTTNICNE